MKWWSTFQYNTVARLWDADLVASGWARDRLPNPTQLLCKIDQNLNLSTQQNALLFSQRTADK
jgi:hypothetical protein